MSFVARSRSRFNKHMSDFQDNPETVRPLSKMQSAELDRLAARFEGTTPQPRIKWPLVLALTMAVVLVGIIIWFNMLKLKDQSVAEGTSSQPTSVAAGVPVEGVLVSVQGKERALQDLRGKVVILAFWQSTCESCLNTLRDLRGLYAQYSEQGLEVLPVEIAPQTEQKEAVEELWMQLAMPFTNFRDPSGTVTKTLQIDSVPTTVVLNKTGQIAMIASGSNDWASGDFADGILQLLEE